MYENHRKIRPDGSNWEQVARAGPARNPLAFQEFQRGLKNPKRPRIQYRKLREDEEVPTGAETMEIEGKRFNLKKLFQLF
jgi:hypothetical protein